MQLTGPKIINGYPFLDIVSGFDLRSQTIFTPLLFVLVDKLPKKRSCLHKIGK
jgi:hypothetical protein